LFYGKFLMNVTGSQPPSNLVLGPLPTSSSGYQQQQQPRGASGNQGYARQPYKHQRRERNTANMSNYETNPIGALQERFQSRGITPTYRVVQADGASHAPTFAFQVILGDITATGTGSSKKQAKHNAARAMLDKLDGRVPAQDGQLPLPEVSDTNGSQAPTNMVGALQEVCVKQGFPMPTYTMGQGGNNQPHQRNFVMICTVGKLKENGQGGSKKDAKREAAQKMIDKLKALGPAEQVAVDDISGGIKIETLTNEASEKVAGFYKTLQNSSGSCLSKLHKATLKMGKGVNYIGMLEDLSKEQSFEVTYVDIEDKTEDGETQCLVQISTLPVAVCYGVGKDLDKAKTEAARYALYYLRMMSKKRGKK
jgi:RISC-loading complex subunit TARBP2